MCTNGTAMAVQQQKPAADSSAMSDGRRHRQDREILRGARLAARRIGEGRDVEGAEEQQRAGHDAVDHQRSGASRRSGSSQR